MACSTGVRVGSSARRPPGSGHVRRRREPSGALLAPARRARARGQPAQRPTIGGLLYPGKRTLLSGETESLKTWLALILAKAEMDIGLPVAWVDLDAMGAAAIVERLRALGVSDEQTQRLFLYYEPDQLLADEALAEVCATVAERDVRVFFIDSFNPMLRLHGLDPNSTPDVEAYWQEVADPITRAGAAPTHLDHVVKNPDGRGKYAYGSERKASGAIVHVGFKPVRPLVRGSRGETLLLRHKDRPGYLPNPIIGKLVLESDGEAVAYRLEAEHGRKGDQFRPTVLMERVSEFLEAQPGPVARRAVEDGVAGKDKAKRQALDLLTAEGYATETAGPHGAQLVELVRPYREAEDELAFAEAFDSTSAPPRPDLGPGLRSTPSQPTSAPDPLIGAGPRLVGEPPADLGPTSAQGGQGASPSLPVLDTARPSRNGWLFDEDGRRLSDAERARRFDQLHPRRHRGTA
jgi:AAA domain